MRITDILHGRIPLRTPADVQKSKKKRPDREPSPGDSNFSLRNESKTEREEKLRLVRDRIASGFYDKPEIIKKVAEAISIQLLR